MAARAFDELTAKLRAVFFRPDSKANVHPTSAAEPPPSARTTRTMTMTDDVRDEQRRPRPRRDAPLGELLAGVEVDERVDLRAAVGLGEEALSAFEEVELDHEGEAEDARALPARELRRGRRGAAGGEEIVDDERPTAPRTNESRCISSSASPYSSS